MTTEIIEFFILIVLFACSAFFSSAETALFSLNPIQIHKIHKHSKNCGTAISTLLAAPSKLLSTILIGNTVVNVMASALGFAFIKNFAPTYAAAISIPLITILLLVFGEVAPKRLAMTFPEKMSCKYSSTLITLIKLMGPLRISIEAITHIFTSKMSSERKTLTEDEFRTIVEVGTEEGVLDEEERTMVDGIIRLEDTQASDIMTPRVDLTGIDLDDSPKEREQTARNVKFRYLPVYRDSLDHIEGILDVPRFLLSKEDDITLFMTSPYFIPETTPLDTLLSSFQREHRKFAIVADEYGGTAGMVTRGDILEEIVDDVDNEYGPKKFEIQNISENEWLIDGTTSLEDINYELDLFLEAEGVDRLSGWVSAIAERIPKAGAVIEHQDCRVRVVKVKKQRIVLLQLEKLNAQQSEEEDE
ncbi:MAG: HlyC/CorC family transporter [Kiritimatiellae bacterium]|nr:HlyC/CorC family transporter [Kiritimatiellia bacterium]